MIADGFDGRTFTGSGVSVQQHVAGAFPGKEGFCIFEDQSAFPFITEQLGKTLGIRVFYRLDAAVFQMKDRILGIDSIACVWESVNPLAVFIVKIKGSRFPVRQKTFIGNDGFYRFGSNGGKLLQRVQLLFESCFDGLRYRRFRSLFFYIEIFII